MPLRNCRPSGLGIAVFIVACITYDPGGVRADQEGAGQQRLGDDLPLTADQPADPSRTPRVEQPRKKK